MTPKFTRTTIPEKEKLGEKLAKKRASLGFDIKEAERATRIRAKHIEALESGDYDSLPPDVYVRGFLKNYSAFLRLDQKKVTSLYLKERGLVENVKKVVSTPAPKRRPKKRKKQKIIITPKRIALGSAIIGALAILGYIGWQVSILAAPPKLLVRSPEDSIKVSEDSIVVGGKTDAGADVFINEVPIGVDPDGNFQEKVSLQKGVNLIKVSSKNKLGKTTQTSRTVLAELSDIASVTQENKQLEMKIDIGPNPNFIYIEVDGKALSDKNTLMLPGSSQLVKAQEKIIISATDGGSVRITLNGKDLGVLGGNGIKIDKKEFTKESI
jgi:cytoskeletal protein RodZ